MESNSSEQPIKSLLNDINNLIHTIEAQSAIPNNEEPPRYLSNKEIINIVNAIPMFPGSTPAIGRTARNSIIKKETTSLRDVVLAPSQIEEFKNTYITKFNMSKVEPGTAVGFTAAEAISAPVSQQTFNAFSNAGSSKNMTGGIEAFIETLEAQHRKHPLMVIHYKEKVSMEDILLKKRQHILTVNVADCVSSNMVEVASSLYANGIPDWYSFYTSIIDNKVTIPTNGWILRLFLNLDALYLYKIKPKQIADLLSSEKDDSGISIVKCIYSPTIKYNEVDTIIMDLFINNMDAITSNKKIDKMDISEDMLGLFYFKNVFIPKLNVFKLKGFDNIKDVDALTLSIQMSLYAEYPATRYANEYKEIVDKYTNYSFIKLNNVYMNFNNIRIEDVLSLLKAANITNIIRIKNISDINVRKDFHDLDFLIEIPPRPSEFPKNQPYDILHLIKYYIDTDTKMIDKYRKDQKLLRREMLDNARVETGEKRRQMIIDANKIKIYKEPSIITKSANLYYAETSGTDYYSVLNNSDIDYTRSYTNDVKELLLYYGIEAVRTYIVRDLIKLVMLSDTYIDPRHATFVADWMTCLGTITPLTAKGMKRHELGAIANAAFREPMKGFKNEAMYNKVDKLSGIAGPIAIGTYIELGTGYVDVRPVDNIRTKAILESTKKQGKKLGVSMSSKIVSLLETPDLINPLDRSKAPISSQSKFKVLNIEMMPSIEQSIPQKSELPLVSKFPSLLQMFPVISKELRQAIDESETCERPLIPMKTSIIQGGSSYPSESLPVNAVNIQNNKQFEAVEKPPQTVVGNTFNIDDLF